MRSILSLPARNLFCSLGILVIALCATLLLAHSQPWLGLAIERGGDGPRLLVAAQGPAQSAGLGAGQQVSALGEIAVEPADLIEDPDILESYPELDRFLDRQEAFTSVLRAQDGILVQAGALARVFAAPERPLASLPWTFWGQLATGSIGFLFGAWVYSLRSAGLTGGFLYLAGAGLMISAFAAAVYSSRELALSATTIKSLSAVNIFGALMFGMGNIGIFLGYPKPLVGGAWRWLPSLVLLTWWALGQLRIFSLPAFAAQLPIATALFAIILLVLLQFIASRGDPRSRAVLSWIGLSVLIGAGGFVTSISLPGLLGFAPALSQSVAFMFFLPIYLGLALGVARYRLFDLQDWAFRIFFYLCGIWLLLALDALLIAYVALERAPAFGLALLCVALLYLPLRDALAAKVFKRYESLSADVYRRISDIALATTAEERSALWRNLLTQEFHPLEISEATSPPSSAKLADEGAALLLPAIEDLAGLRLSWAKDGRRLFTRRDLDHAATLVMMLQGACQSRKAFETGAESERSRIARDMHDNIGIQLSGALHASQVERKDTLIREALSELRGIIAANAASEGSDLAETIADLRAELGEYAELAGRKIDWHIGPLAGKIAPESKSTLRAILREGLGNAIRHSQQGPIEFSLEHKGEDLEIKLRNQMQIGAVCGAITTEQDAKITGWGLGNMAARIAARGGRFCAAPAKVGSEDGGHFLLYASLPLQIVGGKS